MLEHITDLTWIDALGSTGTIIVATLYFATQMRYLNSSDLLFPLGNLLGSALITFSLAYNFNLASALMEFFWISISLIGIYKSLTAKTS